MARTGRIWIALSTLVLVSGCQRTSSEPVGVTQTRTLSVVINPGPGAISMCDSAQLSVTVHEFSGTEIVPDSTRWSSSDSAAISVDRNGMAHALKASAADTLHSTVWHGAESGSAQLVWSVVDARNLVAPCPIDGSASCVLPCGWHM